MEQCTVGRQECPSPVKPPFKTSKYIIVSLRCKSTPLGYKHGTKTDFHAAQINVHPTSNQLQKSTLLPLFPNAHWELCDTGASGKTDSQGKYFSVESPHFIFIVFRAGLQECSKPLAKWNIGKSVISLMAAKHRAPTDTDLIIQTDDASEKCGKQINSIIITASLTYSLCLVGWGKSGAYQSDKQTVTGRDRDTSGPINRLGPAVYIYSGF